MDKVIVKNHPSVEVGRAVYAATNLQVEDLVIESNIVKVLNARDKFSMEFNDEHILISEPGVIVNHSSSPNCRVEQNHLGAFNFIAISDIAEGEEITFDYESNEATVTAFEDCCCGSNKCRGTMNTTKC